MDGKKPQYPPQYRALDFIVQNNRSVRHFAIFPDKQNNGAPDLFEWLLTHRASDYIGFAFSGPYLDLEKELSNLAEKAKVAADRTTKAVKALPEELALLQGKAQERATSIDNQLKEIRVLTIENLNDEGTKLPKLSGKASVEEGLEILEKCLKKIRGLELELFVQAWGDSRDSTKTRVKTAVFPLFPQDAKDKDASQIYSKMSDLFNKLPDSKSARDWPALIIGDPKCQEGLSLHVLASHIMCPALIKQSGARGRRFCFSPGKTSTLFLYVEAPSAKSGKKGKKDCVAERNEWGKLALQLQEQRNQGSVVELTGLLLSDLSVECSLLSPSASQRAGAVSLTRRSSR
ncbi:hypothetical protein EBZ37_14900 [bacterium]|nr:hypothetical protein [bacterium]